jgi:hypothetical protein
LSGSFQFKKMFAMKITRLFLVIAALGVGTAAGAQTPATDTSRVSGMRRITETEYRNSIADIFGKDIQVQGRFEPDRRVGGLLAASGAILSITPTGFQSYNRMANSIASQVVDQKNRARLISCTPANAKAADTACARLVLSQYGLRLFRRPLSDGELASRVKLAGDMATRTGDFHTGLRLALASLMTSPDFLFHAERAILAADGKSWTLDAYSRAARLSHLMWDSTPDAQLLQAARSAALMTTDGLTREADRLMSSSRILNGMRAFYTDFLALDGTVVKDPAFYPKYTDAVADSAREETLRAMLDHTMVRNEDLRDLLTSRKTFINRSLSSVYGVPYNFKSDWVPYEFSPNDNRSGLLTQVTFLSLFSHPNRSSPTKRGVALLEIFMCEPTPAPPADIDFSIANDIHNPNLKTVRQRLLAHATVPACASCHNHSDPIGLALENFDSIGQFRTSENGVKIDVSAKLADKAFSGAIELGKVLRENPKFPACFARKMYSYGTGANSEAVSARTTRGILTEFSNSGYRVPALIKALALSPEFFAVPPPVPAKIPLSQGK